MICSFPCFIVVWYRPFHTCISELLHWPWKKTCLSANDIILRNMVKWTTQICCKRRYNGVIYIWCNFHIFRRIYLGIGMRREARHRSDVTDFPKPSCWTEFTCFDKWFETSTKKNKKDKCIPLILCQTDKMLSLRWRHNGRDSVSKHQPPHCLLNRYWDADQRKHQSSASLAFVWGIHRDR